MTYQRLYIKKQYMRPMHETHNHPLLSIILWITSSVMYFISAETIDMTYVWGFRILSLISLVLIIGVNWSKGIDGLKNMFGKEKSSKKKNNKK